MRAFCFLEYAIVGQSRQLADYSRVDWWSGRLTAPRTTHTHTQTLNGLFSRTTWVGRYQKDKPFWILLKQEMAGWQWHQLNHKQIICTSLQTDNHASTSSFHIFTGRMPFLPPNQQRQSTEGIFYVPVSYTHLTLPTNREV